MTEVEVTTAKAALKALPAEWVSPEFSAAILDRAALTAIHRMVGEQVATATGDVAAATAALTVDPSDATITTLVTTLVTAQAALTAIDDVATILPPITIDASACAQVVAVAGRAMASAAPPAPIALDYSDEMQMWRNASRISSRAAVDAPIATDADRAALASWTDADEQVRQWRDGASMWRSPNSSDVLSTLGAAQSYIDRAAAVADAVEDADKVTSEANAARAAAGLNWSAS